MKYVPLYTFITLVLVSMILNSCAGTGGLPSTDLEKPAGQLQKAEIIEKYFTERGLDLIEGIWIWDDNAYEVAIIKNSFNIYPQYDYIGVITDTRMSNWKLGETKLLLKKTVSRYAYSAAYFMGDKSEYGTTATLPNENMVEMWLPSPPYGIKEKRFLVRTYPTRYSGSKENGGATVRSGTGFFVSKNILATNYHVVAESKGIDIIWNEKRLPATLLIRDQVNDIALLKVAFSSSALEQKLAMEQVVPLSVGDVRKIKDGNKVYTIGFPLTDELGKRARISEGIINSTVGVEDDPRMIQISVPIQPGNSGGPLFNTRGEVIGVVTSTINNAYLILQKGTFPQNVNFAIKANYLNNLVSLLPNEVKLIEGANTKEITASQLMELTSKSVVLIEASN